MDDFVVRERKHEVFGVGIQLAEGQRVVVVASMDRVFLEVSQRVVHPAHVPLHGEAQAAEVDRARNHGPCSGFFRDGERTGELLVHHHVEFLEEIDGFQVFAPAKFVGQPFAMFA